ncbi:MAG TPA: BTAD domain-containing putative transcriptional regulator [Candidatus Limnocylindrales bacterium]|nr:BTAD domain-containing putative transcriptional regulator [Candidatus Limnocylindrales bacterium]
MGILGPFELRLDGGPPVALGGLRQRALLAILALHPNETVAIDRIIDELWGDSPPPSATHTAQVFVSRLRRALSAASDRLATVVPGYRLTLEPMELDADRCERLYGEARAATGSGRPGDAAAKLEQALALWRGPPLADFTYEPFAQGAIGQLEELRVSCREELAEAQLALGHHAEVVQDLETLIAENPLRERPRGQLMLALYRCGRQAEALDAYQQARHMLVENLAIEPSPALRALEQAILQQDASLSAPASSRADDSIASDAVSSYDKDSAMATVLAQHGKRSATAPPRTARGAFVGRLDCLEQLRAQWDESRGGRTNVTWLVGEAGIGKTRLATQFAEEVSGQGGVALYGRADVESLLPYQPLAEVLDDLISYAGSRLIETLERELETLSRPFPNLRRYTAAIPVVHDQETMRYQVFEAVVSVIVASSVDTPLLVVLDDLQWADQPTLLLLRHVLRRAEGARLLVLGTFRPDEPNQALASLLADLRRERLYERLSLDGLDEEGTAKLVADRAGIQTTPAFVHRLHAQTDGNPFFIEETLRALSESRLVGRGIVDHDALEELGVPEGVAEVIMRRSEQLSPLARELLVVASIVGSSFKLRFVEDVIRSERGAVDQELDAAPVDAIAAAADELLGSGLAIEVPDEFEVLAFSHALVREVLYASLTGGRRVRLHHRVAEALERRSEHSEVNPAELAHHFLEARPAAGPEPALRYSIAAARRAAEQFAYEEAAEHLRRALSMVGHDDEAARCDLLLALGRVQWHMGDQDARNTFLAAVESAERRGDADQLARAAIGFGERYFEITYVGGTRYRDLLEKAIAAMPRDDSARRAVLLSRLAVNLAFPNEDERAQSLAAEALAMARRLGNERTLAAALISRHITLLDVRHIEQRLEVGRELVSLAGAPDELAAEGHHWRMYDLLGIGELDSARHEYAELERLAGKLGQPLLRSLAYGAKGLWAELDGEAEQAERWADESLRQAKLAHTADAVSSWGSQMFALRRRQGRVREMAPLAESIVAAGRPLGWLAALGVLRLETGDQGGARAAYDEEMVDGAAALPRGMFWLTRVALLSELCAGLRDGDGAAQLHAELLPHAGRNVVVSYCSFWGPVDGYLALLAETLGDKALAKRHADAALERAEAMGALTITRELQRRSRPVQVAG